MIKDEGGIETKKKIEECERCRWTTRTLFIPIPSGAKAERALHTYDVTIGNKGDNRESVPSCVLR